MSVASPSFITIVAESALALYPILIKNIPANLTTQLTARLGTYASLAYALGSTAERSVAFGSLSSLLYNALNLVHISTSYMSYKWLPAGNALALFYTFPFWTILAGWLVLGETVQWYIIPLLIVAFIGVYLVATNSAIEGYEDQSKSQDTAKGVAASLASAITETLIYLIAKTPTNPSPFLTILQLYPIAAIATAGYGLYENNLSTDFKNTWLPLILFNVCIGFIGYSLRFYAIPKLSASVFSILSFIGVSAAYFFQLIFTDEKINNKALLGASLITGSVAVLEYTK
jgi:drug/metabolite transporter (DMT)-like permease